MTSIIEAIRGAELTAEAVDAATGLTLQPLAPDTIPALKEPKKAKPGKTIATGEAPAAKVSAKKVAPAKPLGTVDRIWSYLASVAGKGMSRKERVEALVAKGFNKATAQAQTQRFDITGGDRKAATAYGKGKAGA